VCGGGPGNSEVSPVATSTGKIVGGVATTLGTPVKHVYAIHDDILGGKVGMARCFPVEFGLLPVANTTDPSGLNCDDLPVADLGPNHKTGARWLAMAIDTAGNLYAVWPEAPVDASGLVTGDTVIKYTFSTDEGTTWASPTTVPLGAEVGDLHVNVFPFVRAGDPGRVDISWVGTPGQPGYPSNGPDSCPNGAAAVAPPAAVCDWYVFMAQALDGLSAAPTFTAPILASDHFIHRGSINTFIGMTTGDRTLGDFFQMQIGLQGEAYLSYADSNLRTHAVTSGTSSSHAVVVRQNGGTGLFAGKQPQGDPAPVNGVTDPSGDARYEAGSVVSASAPHLDITGSSISRPPASQCHPTGTACYRVSMSISNLDVAGGSPAAEDSDTNLVWLTQWLTQSATDPRGGKNFFVFAQSTNKGPLTCFSGDNGTQDNQGGFMLTYPGRIPIDAPGACTSVSGPGGGITIDVPIANITLADPIDDVLHEVTASTMTTPGPADCSCDTDSTVGQLFNLIDVAPAYRVEGQLTRLSGKDRIETAIAISNDSFPQAGSAGAVVLARSDTFPDGLAGTPLAVALHAPLLLTAPSMLDVRTENEITRVLPPGGTVHLLGGEDALNDAIATRLASLGYAIVRYEGVDRYDTAVKIAEMGPASPTAFLLATGTNFPDALAAGAAAAKVHASVLLSDGPLPSPITDAYLAANPSTPHYCIGGPACTAHPDAIQFVGLDRYETSVMVADGFFDAPSAVGIATGENFPDSLGGGAHIGSIGGPLVLTRTDVLPGVVQGYLGRASANTAKAYIYGGRQAVSDAVFAAIAHALLGLG
jgi:hypothetical protein